MADGQEFNVEDLVDLLNGKSRLTVDPPIQRIAQWDDLLSKLDAILKATAENSSREAARSAELVSLASKENEERARSIVAKSEASLAEANVNREVLSTLQSMIRSANEKRPAPIVIDTTPIASAISAFKPEERAEPAEPAEPVARPSYTFTINRSPQGFLETVTATPD